MGDTEVTIVSIDENYFSTMLEDDSETASDSTFSVQPAPVHIDSNTLICQICDKSFKREDKLRRHLLYHKEGNLHHCTVCDKRFTEKLRLQRHALIHDNVCHVCNKQFTYSWILKSHLISHAEDKQLECEICKKT